LTKQFRRNFETEFKFRRNAGIVLNGITTERNPRNSNNVQIERRRLPTLDLGVMNKQTHSHHYHHHRRRLCPVASSLPSPHRHRHVIVTINLSPRPPTSVIHSKHTTNDVATPRHLPNVRRHTIMTMQHVNGPLRMCCVVTVCIRLPRHDTTQQQHGDDYNTTMQRSGNHTTNDDNVIVRHCYLL
jgi:hypothetical protein